MQATARALARETQADACEQSTHMLRGRTPATLRFHSTHLRRHHAAKGQRELHIAPLLGAAAWAGEGGCSKDERRRRRGKDMLPPKTNVPERPPLPNTQTVPTSGSLNADQPGLHGPTPSHLRKEAVSSSSPRMSSGNGLPSESSVKAAGSGHTGVNAAAVGLRCRQAGLHAAGHWQEQAERRRQCYTG